MGRNGGRWLLVAVVFQAGVIAGLVLNGVRLVPEARAQIIPDPAAQQMQTNEILRGIDAKLGRLTELAASGEMKVKVSNLPAERR